MRQNKGKDKKELNMEVKILRIIGLKLKHNKQKQKHS